MKTVFFDPYLDTVGGGERYVLTIADYLSKKGWQVDLMKDKPVGREKFKDKFGINLQSVNFIGVPKNIFEKWKLTKGYDLCFWLSDGSIPFLFSKKNIIHFQVPFHNVGGKSFLNQLKLKRIQWIICNSQFTKRIIDQEFNLKSKVIFPPIDTDRFRPGEKQNLILYVGRFSQLLQAKRHDVLIEVFGKMVRKGFSGWKLILAGGTEIGGTAYLAELKSLARDLPIEFLVNPGLSLLQKVYGKAKIFWSASGYGVSEEENPEKVEHFGITIAEAMAAGCVPLVVAKGGHRDIISHAISGYLWKNEGELIKLTQKLASDSQFLTKMAAEAVKASKKYSREKFYKEYEKIIG